MNDQTEISSYTVGEVADQDKSPFVASLQREMAETPISFHMPGHKYNPTVDPTLAEFWGADLFRADLSELGGNVDYLHAPKGALLEAQRLAARACGADRSFFLINGSTVGNQAMIMSVVRDGHKVIVPRASH